jgi:hypothetical protein
MSRKFALTMMLGFMAAAAWWGGEHSAARDSAPAKGKTKQEILQGQGQGQAPRQTPGQKQGYGPGAAVNDRHTEKVTGPIAVRIELDGAAPAKPGDVYKVVGIVKSSQAIEKVEITWLLAGGTDLVSGKAKDTVSLEAEVEKRIEITVKAARPGAQRVNLRAAATVGSSRFAAGAHYTNRPQPKDFDTGKTEKSEKHGGEVETQAVPGAGKDAGGGNEQKIFQ